MSEREQPPFRFIYDCGSLNKHKASREHEVADCARSACWGQFDILYLSHLHADHVSGLPQLLDSVHVNLAVIPYLGPLERRLIVLRNLLHGVFDLDLLELASSPVSWLLRRGVNHVIEVVHADGQRDNGEDPKPQQEQPTPWHIKLRDGAQTKESFAPGQSSQVTDRHRIFARTQQLDWQLMTYVRPASFGETQNLARLVAQNDARNLVDLRTTRSIRRLRNIYRAVWRDLNWTSLCLLSALSHYNEPQTASRREYPGMYNKREGGERVSGWLGLGDAVLNDPEAVEELRSHFGNDLLARVGMCALPHHGSSANFCPDLLNLFGNAVSDYVWHYVTAPSGSKVHPDESLITLLRLAGLHYSVVTEKLKTRILDFLALSVH